MSAVIIELSTRQRIGLRLQALVQPRSNARRRLGALTRRKKILTGQGGLNAEPSTLSVAASEPK